MFLKLQSSTDSTLYYYCIAITISNSRLMQLVSLSDSLYIREILLLILVIVRPEQPYLERTMVINNNKSISSILRVQHAKHDMQLANSITNMN